MWRVPWWMYLWPSEVDSYVVEDQCLVHPSASLCTNVGEYSCRGGA